MKAIDYKELAKAAKSQGRQDLVDMHIENFKRVMRKKLAKKMTPAVTGAKFIDLDTIPWD